MDSWQTKDGRVLKFTEMTTSHLLNLQSWLLQFQKNGFTDADNIDTWFYATNCVKAELKRRGCERRDYAKKIP